MAEPTVGDGPGASEPSRAHAAGPVGSHIGRYLVIDEIGKQLRIHGEGSTGSARVLREAKAMAVPCSVSTAERAQLGALVAAWAIAAWLAEHPAGLRVDG